MEEDRATPNGRKLPLRVILFPAREPVPHAHPVYILSGGPGQAITDDAGYYGTSWQGLHHDVVLIDMRGTGAGHALDCPVAADSDPQSYLEPVYQAGRFAICRDLLQRIADLTQYTTLAAAADIDEIRRALGHGKINLHGLSYGSRLGLHYLRAYPEAVNAAFLGSVVPTTMRTPLHHAQSAQRAFDAVVASCGRQPACKRAFPTIREDLSKVLARLRTAPARAIVTHPATGRPAAVRLSEEGFGEGLRVMLYSTERIRRIPLLLRAARNGKLDPFAQAALDSNRAILSSIRFGLLMSVTCSEDTARIRSGEVEHFTQGTFMGRFRVDAQMAACALWPKAKIPASYGAPVVSSKPTLFVSGSLDPVTPPAFGAEAARTFRRARHVVVPEAHAGSNACLASMGEYVFTRGIDGLDTRCIDERPEPNFLVRE